MAIRINFAGASILQPGAYSEVRPAESSVAAPALGIVALIGEAEEGLPFSAETGLNAVTFGPDEFQAIQEKYGSGELVDAAALAIAPSNDPDITGGAQELILLKTNASTTAQTSIPQGASNYGTVKAKKAGASGNQIAVQVAIVAGKAVITISRLDTGESEVSDPIGGNKLMSIQCTDAVATAATITITDTKLTTTVTGGTAQPLNIDLAKFPTISQLVAFINAQPGYSASAASAAAAARSTHQLDRVSAEDIKAAAFDINRDAYDVQDFFSQSALVRFEPAIKEGLPTAFAKTFLAGGAKGATSQAAIQSCLDALLRRRVNFIVPLFSRDAADDIAENLTDASSGYAINAVHAAAIAHCNQASTVKGRKERQAFLGFKGSWDDTVEKSAEANAFRAQLCFQDPFVRKASSGLVEQAQPHMLGVISAGMKAAARVGLPNTFKAPSISGIAHTEFDPETQGDKAIAANLCYVEANPQGGFRFKLDNSTYAQDKDAWIYNRPSVLYAADVAAYSIRINTEQFVGQRNSDVSPETVKNLMVGVLDQLKSAGIIVADLNTGGRGYKDLTVRINGSVVEIGVTLALVEGLEFVLSSIKVQRAG
jgi:hypothetical protein